MDFTCDHEIIQGAMTPLNPTYPNMSTSEQTCSASPQSDNGGWCRGFHPVARLVLRIAPFRLLAGTTAMAGLTSAARTFSVHRLAQVFLDLPSHGAKRRQPDHTCRICRARAACINIVRSAGDMARERNRSLQPKHRRAIAIAAASSTDLRPTPNFA